MTENNYALVSLYHPTGSKVSIPLSLAEELTATNASILLRSVDALINAGFTVNLPGLMDGENFEQIGFAVRREKVNDDGTSTPVVDVYPVNGAFRALGLYLNGADDVKAFETAAGLRLDAMPLYDGNPIERGKNPRMDKNVVPLKSPAKLVWKLNPKYEGETDKKHPKRVFVRWEGLRPQVETVVMTFEQACDVLTPGGNKLGTLDKGKLQKLATSTADSVTDEMREAANIILKGK